MKRILLFLITVTMATSGLYGRSISYMKSRGGLPAIGKLQVRLNLSDKRITSLEGIDEIRRIEQVRILRLDNNNITSIAEGVLKPLEDSLYIVDLSDNQLTADGLGGLSGLKNLQALILNSNDIDDIPQEVLDGLPNLTFISLYDNPIKAEKINLLRNKGYYVSTWPITRSNLRKAGLAATGLISLILSVRGIKKIATVDSQELIDKSLRAGEGTLKNTNNLLKLEVVKAEGYRELLSANLRDVVSALTQLESVKNDYRSEEVDAMIGKLNKASDKLREKIDSLGGYQDVAKFNMPKDLSSEVQKTIGDFINAGKQSSEAEMRQLFRAHSRKLHPDKKGGSKEAQQALNSAWDYIKGQRGWKR